MRGISGAGPGGRGPGRAAGIQNPSCASAPDTRVRVASDFIGNERKKSVRVSTGLRSRTFEAHAVARAASPARLCAATAIIAICKCAPGEHDLPGDIVRMTR